MTGSHTEWSHISPGTRSRGTSVISLGLAGILDVRDGGDLHVVELAILAFDAAYIDVVDDVAGLGVDEHGTARAFENLSLHGGQQGVAGRIALGGFQGFVDDAHAVVGTY